jgi:hypothetical protein
MFLVALSEYDQVLVECDNEVSSSFLNTLNTKMFRTEWKNPKRYSEQ